MSDNNETKNNYKEFGDKVKSTIGAVGAGLETTAKEVSKNLDISNLGKTTIKLAPKPISVINDIDSIAKAQGEKEVLTEVYKIAVGNIGAAAGGLIGSLVGPVGSGFGAAGGNWIGGNWIAKSTADEVYNFYQNTKQVTSSFAIDLYVAYESLPTFTSKPYPKRSSEDVFKNLRCLQPTISQSPNLTNKNISVSLRSAISSKTTQNPKDETLNPKNLINQPATFSIKNPSKLLNNRPNKVYSGILSNVKYLGFETLENSLNHRHFFHFKVESVLIKMSLNKANRIYIDLITQCNDILPSLAKIA